VKLHAFLTLAEEGEQLCTNPTSATCSWLHDGTIAQSNTNVSYNSNLYELV